jgi:hypothetical protein
MKKRRESEALHCVFFPFAGNSGSYSQQRREGKKKAGQIRPFPGIVSGSA